MGNLNIKWIIIGVIFLILVVAFGRNPVQERREAREEAKKGKDMLVESINEHNSGRRTTKLDALNFGGDGDSEIGAKARSRRVVAPAAPGGDVRRPVRPADPADNTASEPQGYYPPPPLPGTGVAVR